MNTVGLCMSPSKLELMRNRESALDKYMEEGNILVFNTGLKTRNSVSDKGIGEVWIHSCEDVEPINLAATLKSDSPSRRITLVASERCGSLLSRAHAAGIDRVVESGSFLESFRELSGFQDSYMTQNDNSNLGEYLKNPKDKPMENESVNTSAPLSFLDSCTSESQNAFDMKQIASISIPGQSSEMTSYDEKDSTLNIQKELFSINDAVARVSARKKEGRAFILSIFSGSGGAGKSSLAATSALLLKKSDIRTLLFDCDLQFGDIHKMVSIEDVLECDVALRQPEKLKDLVESKSNLSVIAAPKRLENSEKIAVQLASLLNYLSGHYEAIIINTGGAWSDQHAILLECSSASLFLVDQRASSVHACKHALELCARCGIATSPFYFALNRCKRGNALSSIDVSCALEGASVYEIKDGGNEIEEYLSSGDAEGLIELKNDYVKSVDQLLCSLMPRFKDKTSHHFRSADQSRGLVREKRSRRIRRKRK